MDAYKRRGDSWYLLVCKGRHIQILHISYNVAARIPRLSQGGYLAPFRIESVITLVERACWGSVRFLGAPLLEGVSRGVSTREQSCIHFLLCTFRSYIMYGLLSHLEYGRLLLSWKMSGWQLVVPSGQV